MIYLDSSALVKLVLPEAETSSLGEFLIRRGDHEHVSSALLAIEIRRTVARVNIERLSYADLLLEDVRQLSIDGGIVSSASRLPGEGLRSLDAIQLATALLLRPELDAFITYDKRLGSAAEQHGLPVVAPGY